MDEAAVFSIHGFCQRVLTEFAFESGQGFELEVLADDAELWRAAVQDWWRRTAYPLRPAEARLFDAAVGDLEGLRGRLAPLLRSPAPELLPAVASVTEVLDRLAPALLQLADIAAEWRNRREDLASALLGSKALKQAKGTPFRPDALRASLAELDAYFAPAPSVSAGESPGEAPAEPPPPGFKVLDATVIRAHLKKGKIDPALEDPFFERCAEVNAVIAGIVSDLRVAASADAAAFARAQVRRVKADAGLLSYDDMLTHLRDALADTDGSGAADGTDATRGTGAAALVRAVTARYPVAMIDEFQDTDPLQWEIFRRLYLDGHRRADYCSSATPSRPSTASAAATSSPTCRRSAPSRSRSAPPC
jgi:exodeoxyribonuclease V beta subunit